MNTDLQSISLEPLMYMLMHSAVFVTILGVVFFFIGLLFGYATWGRYKRQTRELRGEAVEMKDEIAQLKRRVADRAVKSGPVAAMATETIHMPPRNASTVTAQVETEPSAVEERPSEFESTSSAATALMAHTTATEEKPTAPAAKEKKTSPLAAIVTASALHKDKKKGVGSNDSIMMGQGAIPSLSDLPELPKQEEIYTTEDPRLGPIYKKQPANPDDLTALKGIAKVLEKRLHDLGIYTYAQIASWNDAQIQEVSSRLAFKDRIHREGWVRQAQTLMEKSAATGERTQAVD